MPKLTYTVKPGESFYSIAQKVLGSQRFAGMLIEANPNIVSLRPGMEIDLPDISGLDGETVFFSQNTFERGQKMDSFRTSFNDNLDFLGDLLEDLKPPFLEDFSDATLNAEFEQMLNEIFDEQAYFADLEELINWDPVTQPELPKLNLNPNSGLLAPDLTDEQVLAQIIAVGGDPNTPITQARLIIHNARQKQEEEPVEDDIDSLMRKLGIDETLEPEFQGDLVPQEPERSEFDPLNFGRASKPDLVPTPQEPQFTWTTENLEDWFQYELRQMKNNDTRSGDVGWFLTTYRSEVGKGKNPEEIYKILKAGSPPSPVPTETPFPEPTSTPVPTATPPIENVKSVIIDSNGNYIFEFDPNGNLTTLLSGLQEYDSDFKLPPIQYILDLANILEPEFFRLNTKYILPQSGNLPTPKITLPENTLTVPFTDFKDELTPLFSSEKPTIVGFGDQIFEIVPSSAWKEIPFNPNSENEGLNKESRFLIYTDLKNEINSIVVHHTGEIQRLIERNLTIEEQIQVIQNYHMTDEGLSDIAYHFIIASTSTPPSSNQPTIDMPKEISPEEKYFLIFEDKTNKSSSSPSKQIYIPGFYYELSWSPKGDQIALIGEIEVESIKNLFDNIFLLNLQTNSLTPLTDFGFFGIGNLNWVGDQNTFSFVSYDIFSGIEFNLLTTDPNTDILYTIDNLQQIDALDGAEINPGPWTKDGQEISYIKNNLIFKFNIESSIESQLVDTEAIYSEVSISNNGEWVAYIIGDKDRGCTIYCQQNIFLLNLQNSKTYQLTNDKYGYSDLKWSPDDQYLMFLSNRHDPGFTDCDYQCKTDIFIARLGNPNVVSITSDEYDYYSPTWSPDGMQIAFISKIDRNYDIYIMDVSEILP